MNPTQSIVDYNDAKLYTNKVPRRGVFCLHCDLELNGIHDGEMHMKCWYEHHGTKNKSNTNPFQLARHMHHTQEVANAWRN